jgi:uncharacterized protein Yka (UPF0111/DUF47 family)
MKALRRLFGYDDKFFDLLEASAVAAQNSVHLLAQMISQPAGLPTLDEFILSRRKDKKITETITEELCRTFVTPLEREDIEALSIALYKIPKTCEKFGEKYLLCDDQIRGVNFSEQVKLLGEAVNTVVQMVRRLRTKSNLEIVKDDNDRLHHLEGQADKVMLALIRELYSGKHDTLKVIILLDLYEMLERCVDRCRDAGNVVFQIVLKHS